MSTLPTPACERGYTREQVEIICGDLLESFDAWLYGQTLCLCEGQRYNHETGEYEVACGGVAHGLVVYPWDLERFLAH